jgi:integrase
MGRRRGHGKGSIHQRSDGRWCAIVDLGRDTTGKRRRKYLYGKTRKEVADQLKLLHNDQAGGVNVTTDRQTVKTFLARWLTEVAAHRNKLRTWEGYKCIVGLYLNPYLGRILLTKLGPEHVQRMINTLVTKDLAPNTIRNIRAVLRRALNQALRWRLVTFNAASLAEIPHIEQEEMSALDEQQARALLRTLKGERLEVLYRVGLSLGLRRGEILGLRWIDVDFERATLSVAQTLQRTKAKGLIFSTPKTKGSVRTIPMPRVLLAALKLHKERQDQEGVENPYGLVCISTKGTPLDPDDITHRFKAFVKAAGLPVDIHFHSLRHSCATLLLAQGVPMHVVKDILGHSQISTTMRYAHPTEQTMRDATAEMDMLLPEEQDEEEEKEGD